MSEQLHRTPGTSLDQQINELGAIRNAGTRAPEFKAWRQATLTLIQRIWPSHAEYAERFRRVPFTSPDPRADRHEAREWFERGCGEALTYLKMLRDHCGDRQWSDVDSESANDHFEPGSSEDDFPTLDLPPSGEARSKPAPKPGGGSKPKKGAHKGPPKMTAPPKPPVSPVLGELLAEAEGRTQRPAPPPLPLDESRVPPPDASAPRKEYGRSKTRAAKLGKKGAKPRLKDMLGLGEDPIGSAAPDAVEAPPHAVEPPRSTMARAVERPERTIAPVPRINPAPERLAEPAAGNPARPAASDVRIPPLPPAAEPAVVPEMEFPNEPAGAPAPRTAAAQTPLGASLGDMLLGPDVRARIESAVAQGPEAPAAKPEMPPQSTPAPPAGSARGHMTDPYTSYGQLEGDQLDSISRVSQPSPPPDRTVEPAMPPVAPALPEIPEVEPPPAAFEALEPEAPELEAAELETPELDPADLKPTDIDDGDEFEPAGEDPDELEAERATEEFLRNSPVLHVNPRPAPNRPEPDPGVQEIAGPPADAVAKAHSVEAAVIRGLTPIVGDLGVPAGQRAVARAMLADLARTLDQNEVTWEGLREAVGFVMEYPPLARRVLPLLMPYFDRAA